MPPQPRDATRAEKEEIIYLNLSELFPFKDHPFGVRDDAEMKGLVESVKDNGVHQPALVRPREGGGYEIIAGQSGLIFHSDRGVQYASSAYRQRLEKAGLVQSMRGTHMIMPLRKISSAV